MAALGPPLNMWYMNPAILLPPEKCLSKPYWFGYGRLCPHHRSHWTTWATHIDRPVNEPHEERSNIYCVALRHHFYISPTFSWLCTLSLQADCYLSHNVRNENHVYPVYLFYDRKYPYEFWQPVALFSDCCSYDDRQDQERKLWLNGGTLRAHWGRRTGSISQEPSYGAKELGFWKERRTMFLSSTC